MWFRQTDLAAVIWIILSGSLTCGIHSGMWMMWIFVIVEFLWARKRWHGLSYTSHGSARPVTNQSSTDANLLVSTHNCCRLLAIRFFLKSVVTCNAVGGEAHLACVVTCALRGFCTCTCTHCSDSAWVATVSSNMSSVYQFPAWPKPIALFILSLSLPLSH